MSAPYNDHRLNNRQAFTLVELLIVIVVIAILAAIGVVAYSGIRERGMDAKYASEAESIRKSALMVHSSEGIYPYGNTNANIMTALRRSGASNLPSIRNLTGVTSCSSVSGFPSSRPCNGVEVSQWAARGNSYGLVACEPIVTGPTGSTWQAAGLKIYYPSMVDANVKIYSVGDTSNCSTTVLDAPV